MADLRASTPTAAGKAVVPDVGEERARLTQARTRLRGAVTHLLRRERDGLAAMRSRPVLARPELLLQGRAEEVDRLRSAARRGLADLVTTRTADVARLEAQVRALSPAATLDRGYAVVQRADDGGVVRRPDDAPAGTRLQVRVAEGEIAATAES